MVDNCSNPDPVRVLEIRIETKKVRRLTKCQKCRVLWGWETVLISSLVLGVGAHNSVTFLLYTNFQFSFARSGVSGFFVMGMLACLLIASFVFRTCQNIAPRRRNKRNKTNRKILVRMKTNIRIAINGVIARYMQLFDVNGNYYLIKMYASEAFEHIQQVYSLTTFYVCLMPVAISSTVCAVLAFELMFNMWATFHMATQVTRDRLILMDIVTDLFCLVFPVSYTYFVNQVPVKIDEMRFITLYPSFSLLLKLNDIWGDYFKIDLERLRQTPGESRTRERSHRRSSILRLSVHKDLIQTQLNHFPNWMRYGFACLNLGFLLFFISIVCVHLTTIPSTIECSDMLTAEVWNGCRSQVPFCQHAFLAKCDCAVLEMQNYTRKALPESFINLKSLAKIIIFEGQLEQLPSDIGDNHMKLIALTVRSTKLKLLPDTLVKITDLAMLHLGQNKLMSLPKDIGNLENLITLYVDNNQLTSLPESAGDLINLRSFAAQNNRLKSLPISVGSLEKLEYIQVWNNSLASLPDDIGSTKSMLLVDVRHNQLSELPASVRKWTNIKYLYLSGNPLCDRLDIPSNLETADGLCEDQCAVNCPMNWIADGVCDIGCNTKSCEHDKGDCTDTNK